MAPVKAAIERMNGEIARIVDASGNADPYPMDSATWSRRLRHRSRMSLPQDGAWKA